MSRRSRYRTSQEILDAVFALPSDPENSSDDEESSDNDFDPSAADHLPSDSNCQLSSDDDDDDILYRLASDVTDVESASDVSSQDSDDNAGGWTRNVLQRASIDFDSMRIVPKQPFSADEGPVDFFRRYFDHDVFQLRIQQTNLYAKQKKTNRWNDVTLAEMEAFVGLLIAMGLHVVPTTECYWSTNPLFRVQPVADIMTIKRYKKIRQVLHLNDNEKMPKRGDNAYDKLYKVRPLIDKLNSSFSAHGLSTLTQSVDEAMIKFKGRSSIKQYMPMKPTKRGYKVWVRCDSTTGYVYQFEIYTGKADTGEISTGLGGKVVLNLSQALVGSGCHLAFDNFFSSYELMEKLHASNIFATGTVRTNRNDLPQLARGRQQ